MKALTKTGLSQCVIVAGMAVATLAAAPAYAELSAEELAKSSR